MDQAPVEVDLKPEAPAEANRAAGDQVVWDRDLADQVEEVRAGDQDRVEDQVEEVRVGGQDRAAEVQLAQVVADQAAVRKSAHGLELAAAMAARVWFREWSPVLRGDPRVGAASRQKKSFWGFSER
jgi:hypothetical protein